MQNLRLALCIVHCALCISACSVPNLQKPECAEARDALKQFYSFHFANDMRPAEENLKIRSRFLTPELTKSLEGVPANSTDYFTATDQAPKTFKIGKCVSANAHQAKFQVQLYWRDDIETVQKEIEVETIESGGTWLINKVTN